MECVILLGRDGRLLLLCPRRWQTTLLTHRTTSIAVAAVTVAIPCCRALRRVDGGLAHSLARRRRRERILLSNTPGRGHTVLTGHGIHLGESLDVVIVVIGRGIRRTIVVAVLRRRSIVVIITIRTTVRSSSSSLLLLQDHL